MSTPNVSTDNVELNQNDDVYDSANAGMSDDTQESPVSQGNTSKTKKGNKKVASTKTKAKSDAKKTPAAKKTPVPAVKKAPASDAGSAGAREDSQIANLFKMASDGTRVSLIRFLKENGEAYVGLLCNHVGQSQPAVSHHLAILRHAEVVVPRREGKNNFYALSQKGEALAGAIVAIS